MVGLLDRWAEQRKEARVLLVHRRVGIDERTGRLAASRRSSTSPSKRPSMRSVSSSRDEVGLRVFTTGLGDGH